MIGWASVAVACFGAVVASPGAAQAPAPASIPTVSRLVVVFTEHELRLTERIRARDAAGVGNLLTDDFELRASPRPGRPVPRADWIRQSTASPPALGVPTQMAVHDLGTAAVVSFLQPAEGAKGSLFVIDLWRRVGEDWKLAVRYAAPAGSTSVPIPGVPPAAKEIPKRY
jgi:hypothetical protein